MDAAYVSALAALAGSVIGGLTSLAASWLTQNVQARTQQLVDDKNHRRDLYRAFIEEASRLYAGALTSDGTEITNFVTLYALVSRMRVMSSLHVAECADKVIRSIVETHFAPNMTLSELRTAIGQDRIDLLRRFSEACREDLRS